MTDPVPVVQSSTSVAVSPTAPLVTINGSTAKGLALSLVTGGLRILGAYAVGHGLATQDMADAAIPVAAQEAVGVLLAVGGQLWAMWREKQHSELTMKAAEVLPSQVVLK